MWFTKWNISAVAEAMNALWVAPATQSMPEGARGVVEHEGTSLQSR